VNDISYLLKVFGITLASNHVGNEAFLYFGDS